MAKPLSELEDVVREALCAWQFLRQLGYTAEQIFAGVDSGRMYVQARWRGMDFTYGVGESDLSMEQFESVWAEAAEAMQTAPEEELDAMWFSSRVLAAAHVVLSAMIEKGIYWPSHENFRDLN